MMNAREAFEAWMLKVEIVAGGVCLLIFAVCLAVAVVLIAKTRRKEV
jgi:hypothetical protein